MKEQKFNNFSLWKFDNLSKDTNILHFVSGKLNLSFNVGAPLEHVSENRLKLASALSINQKTLIFPEQTHSNNVVIVEENNELNLKDTDALITNKNNICIAVMAADCVPILLCDQELKVIAAVHSGWRGTQSKILTRTIDLMKSTFGTNPSNIKVAIGPSICADIYEVGEEVSQAFLLTYGKDVDKFIIVKHGKKHLDLWKANAFQLLKLGVPEDNIEIASICTYQNEDKFYSARKSGIKTGRFAAGIMIL